MQRYNNEYKFMLHRDLPYKSATQQLLLQGQGSLVLWKIKKPRRGVFNFVYIKLETVAVFFDHFISDFSFGYFYVKRIHFGKSPETDQHHAEFVTFCEGIQSLFA